MHINSQTIYRSMINITHITHSKKNVTYLFDPKEKNTFNKCHEWNERTEEHSQPATEIYTGCQKLHSTNEKKKWSNGNENQHPITQ